jgi:hypothetical protein
MKSRFLFPHKWRIPGIALLVLGIVPVVLYKHYTDQLIYWQTTHPLFWEYNIAELLNILANDLSIITFILGLLFIGFSKEKIEDEQIAQLRMDCLQRTIYFNYIVLIACVITINGMAFFSILVYNLISPLVFFIILFRYKIYQLNRLTQTEEGRV